MLKGFEKVLLLQCLVTIFACSFEQPCSRHRKPNSLPVIVHLAPVVLGSGRLHTHKQMPGLLQGRFDLTMCGDGAHLCVDDENSIFVMNTRIVCSDIVKRT